MQVKVWFQNRRTKYKRAKADEDETGTTRSSEHDARNHSSLTPDDSSSIDDFDDDNDEEMSKHSDEHQRSVASSSSRPASPAVVTCGLPRCSSPISSLASASTVAHHGLGGLHGLYSSQASLTRTPQFNGCDGAGSEPRRHHQLQQQGAGAGAGSNTLHPSACGNTGNGSANSAKRSKTSHHVNRWRAETNQL